MTRFVVLLGALVFLSIHVHAEMRIWTSTKGDTVEAEFVSVFSDKVVLRKVDGKEIRVPMKGLSSGDIKYINEVIPPTMSIDVKPKIDKETQGSFSGYVSDFERRGQTIKCVATIKKTSRMDSNAPLKAHFYVFAKNIKSDEFTVISKTTHDFSFANQKEHEITSSTAKVQYTKSSFHGNFGSEYEGFLVYVEDACKQVIACRGSRPFFTENIHKIKLACDGSQLDKDLDIINAKKKH